MVNLSPTADRRALIKLLIAGITVAALGGVVLLLAALADVIGLSGSGSEGWGTRQTMGVIVGLIGLIGGGALYFMGRRSA